MLAIATDNELVRALSCLDGLRIPLATAAWVTADSLCLRLADGRELAVPLAKLPRLLSATPSQLSNFRLIGLGFRIRWKELNVDLLVADLVTTA